LHPLRVWQSRLWHDLERNPDDRKVVFVVDQIGNSGKSWFAKYVLQLKGADKVQIIRPGKSQDMAYALRSEISILFVDSPRSKSEFLQYDFFEAVKDGMVFNSKYESRVKFFMGGVHVVVLMNEHPKMDALSADRYDVRVLSAEDLVSADVANV
jgi:hypothetical protein